MYYISEQKDKTKATLIIPVQTKHFDQFLEILPSNKQAWFKNTDFKAHSGQVCLLPGDDFSIEEVYLGIEDETDDKALAKAANQLPEGVYALKSNLSFRAMLSWGLAQYQFTHYKSKKEKQEKRELLLGEADCVKFKNALKAHFLVRDLINQPAEALGPNELKIEAEQLAKAFGAKVNCYEGVTLEKDYPAIYAVGRGASQKPCLIELDWGGDDLSYPMVAIVGKGVCFDTGGLDLKPSSNMRLMKKDMGGAAHVLGLAYLIMSHQLPIRLKMLIPAVENAISHRAYRPGDIVKTRKGLSVEIDNTDAEGRVVLADALAKAVESKPELIIDFATLTGAARVALGTDIAAMFSNSDEVSDALSCEANKLQDWVWRLPLFKTYLKQIQPSIADLANSAKTGFGGAITAALFLQQFVSEVPWVHLDIMAWNKSSSPGKPEGGEALGLHAVFAYLENRFQSQAKA